ELAACRVDRVGGYLGAVAMHRIEETFLAIKCDELRVGRALGGLQQRPGATRVDPVEADSLSLRLPALGGEAADIDRERPGRGLRFLRRGFRRSQYPAGAGSDCHPAGRACEKEPASAATRHQFARRLGFLTSLRHSVIPPSAECGANVLPSSGPRG